MMADQAVALITAGASGIGLTCARALSAEGYAVLTMDINATAVAAFQAEFGEQTAVVCDVSDAEQVVAAWGQLIESRGRIDVLINNAGIAGPQQPVEEIDVESWQQTINTDLNSAFYVTRLVVPLMKAQRSGVILNMSSSAGRHGCPLRSPYVAAKWAAIGLAQTWAMELGPWNIRVNALCPGSVGGERIDRVIERDATERGVEPEAIRNLYLRQSSLRAFASAEDIAAMVCFLVGPGGQMISGQTLGIDGHTESLANWLDA
jgi:NAD(P)-dependent dehydrogenase (short-subunit alcohol dehydrogenase family)